MRGGGGGEGARPALQACCWRASPRHMSPHWPSQLRCRVCWPAPHVALQVQGVQADHARAWAAGVSIETSHNTISHVRVPSTRQKPQQYKAGQGDLWKGMTVARAAPAGRDKEGRGSCRVDSAAEADVASAASWHTDTTAVGRAGHCTAAESEEWRYCGGSNSSVETIIAGAANRYTSPGAIRGAGHSAARGGVVRQACGGQDRATEPRIARVAARHAGTSAVGGAGHGSTRGHIEWRGCAGSHGPGEASIAGAAGADIEASRSGWASDV